MVEDKYQEEEEKVQHGVDTIGIDMIDAAIEEQKIKDEEKEDSSESSSIKLASE